MELGTFTRCSSNHDTSALSKRRSLALSFTAMLLAMMTDHRPHIRELGLRRVMEARAADPSGQIPRFKVLAKLNFDAVEYFDNID